MSDVILKWGDKLWGEREREGGKGKRKGEKSYRGDEFLTVLKDF